MALQTCGLNLDRDFKELQPHGTLDFPCAGFSKVYKDNADDVIPWHWHEGMEVLYLETGHLRLEIPGKTFHLKAGEGYIINSNILHFAVAEPVCRMHSLVFNPRLITGNDDSVFAIKYITPLTGCTEFDGCMLDSGFNSDYDRTACFLNAFSAISSEEESYEFTVREQLSKLSVSLYRQFKGQIHTGFTECGQDNVRIRKMLDYIHNHYFEDLSLAQIAKSADIGERECLRCFKRIIKVSPMQYLLKHRIMQASSLLSGSPDFSISEIASRCGFDSPSSFSQMFKRFFKCTPREYRNGNQS